MNLEDLKRVETIQQYLGSVLAQLMASGRGDIDSIITMCQDAIWAIETAFTNMHGYVEELRRSNAQTLETLATVRAASEQYKAMRRAHERAWMIYSVEMRRPWRRYAAMTRPAGRHRTHIVGTARRHHGLQAACISRGVDR